MMRLAQIAADAFNSSLKDTSEKGVLVVFTAAFNSSLKDTDGEPVLIVEEDLDFQFLIKGYASCFSPISVIDFFQFLIKGYGAMFIYMRLKLMLSIPH